MGLKDRILEVLRESGSVSEEDLSSAIELQKERGGSISDALVKLGVIDDRSLLMLLSKNIGIPPVELSRFHITEDLIKLVPAAIAQKYNVVPVGRLQKSLTIAVADPLNIFMFDDLKKITGLDINPVLASASDIEDAIERLYQQSAKDEIDSLLEESQQEELELVNDREQQEEVALNDLKEGPVVKVTNYIIKSAVEKKVSDLLIEPMEKKMRVRFRIDGVLHEQEEPPRGMLFLIISRIKVMSNLNIAEHRLPQDGRFRMQISGRDVDFRVSVIPSALGEKVTIRILDKGNAMLDLNALGYEPDVIEKIQNAALRPNGLILTCGPTGQGKTTTLYSVLKFVDSPEKNIITVEDPIEYELTGINQVQVISDVGMTFSAALRSILRQDPDIIMVGEIRDYETVDIAIKAALTGHLVLSTVHTTTACGTVTRFINMGVEPFLVASSLLGVIAQRLVRKLCDSCKQEMVIPEELQKEFSMPADLKVFKPVGCSNCAQSGYKGRIAVCEFIQITTAMKEAIVNGASENDLRRIARSEGCISMRSDALIKFKNGLTSAEEVLRVTTVD